MFMSLFLAIQGCVGAQHQAGQSARQNSQYLVGNTKETLVKIRIGTAQGSTLVLATDLFSILWTLWDLTIDTIAQVIHECKICTVIKQPSS